MAKARATRRRTKKDSSSNGATLGFEAQLWQAADALRGSMDAAEYKHVVLGRVSRCGPSGTASSGWGQRLSHHRVPRKAAAFGFPQRVPTDCVGRGVQ